MKATMAPVKQKILVVDDDATMGLVLKGGLEMNGFDARYEACSSDVIKVCLEFRPDLVLLDVDMPVKDGKQVASELKLDPTLRGTPVIFLTSQVSNKEPENRSAPDEMLLAKPIPIPRLVATIRDVLQMQSTH